MPGKSLFYSIINDYRNKLVTEYGSFYHFDFMIDRDGLYPRARDYAKTDGFTIYFSPKILSASKYQIEGLVAHEIAHTVFIKLEEHDHTECETDILAEFLFGKNIYYDDTLVQNTLQGIRPRPPYLPN
jgi:predicted metal-dependent peptidase